MAIGIVGPDNSYTKIKQNASNDAEGGQELQQVIVPPEYELGRNGMKALALVNSLVGASSYDGLSMPKVKRIRNIIGYVPKNIQGCNEKCACGSGKQYKHCCGK